MLSSVLKAEKENKGGGREKGRGKVAEWWEIVFVGLCVHYEMPSVPPSGQKQLFPCFHRKTREMLDILKKKTYSYQTVYVCVYILSVICSYSWGHVREWGSEERTHSDRVFFLFVFFFFLWRCFLLTCFGSQSAQLPTSHSQLCSNIAVSQIKSRLTCEANF